MVSDMVNRAIAYEHVIEVSEEEALEIIKKHENPLAFYFWMDDCPPCNLMKPKLRLAAREYHKKIKIFSVRLTDESKVEAKLRIAEIPTILIYSKKGKVTGRLQGLLNQKEIVAAFERAIAD